MYYSYFVADVRLTQAILDINLKKCGSHGVVTSGRQHTPQWQNTTAEDPKFVRAQRRKELRELNEKAWDGENVFHTAKTLDTSLKKNTAFIKRCRVSLADESLKILLSEVASLSLEKYLTEILAALVEGFTKIRTSADIFAGVEVASALHQRFSTKFSPRLLAYFLQGISNPPRGSLKALAPDARVREDQARNSRHKIVLRVLIELWLVGVFRTASDAQASGEEVPRYALQKLDDGSVAPPPLAALEEVANYDLEYFTANQLMTVLLKNYGGVLAGVREKPYEAGLVPGAVRARFLKLFQEYTKMLQNALTGMARELRKMEKRNERTYIRVGKVLEDRQDAAESLLVRFEEMEAGCKTLSELLGMPMPEYKTTTAEAESEVHISIGVAANDDEDAGIWDDEEQRKFYEDIMDIRVRMGMSDDEGEGTASPDDEGEQGVDDVMKELDSLLLETAEPEPQPPEATASADPEPETVAEPETADDLQNETETQDGAAATAGARVVEILTSLAAQSSRAHVDTMALEFIRFNNRATRARAIKFFTSEISVHDSHLLPFYGRFLATINPVCPEIVAGVVGYLDSYFKWLHKRRKADNLMARRMFNIRFISELTKFDLVPKITILNKLMLMIEHIDSFNIANLFALFEGCGRYLMRKPATHPVLVKLLKVLEHKKQTKYFTPDERAMIDGAVLFLNPPKTVVHVKERSVIEQYVRQLVYKDLDKDTADAVLLQLRRMDWRDPDTRRVLLKVFCKIHKVKYSNIIHMARFVSVLRKYYPSFVVKIVDHLLENIRRGLETLTLEAKQRRISEVAFLGCLAQQGVVDSELVLDVLFLLCQFGYPQNQPRPDYYNELDPPGDFFRVRLACSLLDVTADVLDRTSRRWDVLIKLLQYYIYTKAELSMDMEFQVHDTFERLDVPLASDLRSAALGLRTAIARARGVELPQDDTHETPGASDSASSSEPSEQQIVDDKQRRLEEAQRRKQARLAEAARQDAKAVGELEREFQMVMAERMDRKADKKTAAFDEPVPSLRGERESQPDTTTPPPPGKVGFMLLTKKGARVQTRQVHVPSDVKFVSSVEEERARRQQEQDKIRNIVLNYDYADASNSAPLRRIVQPVVASVKYTRRKKESSGIPDEI